MEEKINGQKLLPVMVTALHPPRKIANYREFTKLSLNLWLLVVYTRLRVTLLVRRFICPLVRLSRCWIFCQKAI